MRKSSYLVIALGVLSTMITAALTANVSGFTLPPVADFGLIVLAAPIPWVLAILPQLGVAVPALPMLPAREPAPAPELVEPGPLHTAP